MQSINCKSQYTNLCQRLVYIGSFIFGATLLGFLSIVHKRFLGIPIEFEIRAFVMPGLVGGCVGLGIGTTLFRLKLTNTKLKQNQEYLQDFMDNASDLIQSIAPDGKILYTNQAWRRALGYQPVDLMEKYIFDFIAAEDHAHCKNDLSTVLGGKTIRTRFALITKNGEKVYVDGWVNCRFENGKPLSTRAILRNITETRQAEEAQRLAAKVFEYANDGIFVTDKDGFILAVNNEFMNTTSFSNDDLVRQRPIIFICLDKNTPNQLAEMHKAIFAGENWEGEVYARKKSGETFPASVKLSNVKDNAGNITNFIGLITDITARKETEERLHYLATHDLLTNLPNRTLFIDCLQDAIWNAEQKEMMVAILFMDLDGFKAINDMYGHAFGDEYLSILAKRLKNILAESDTIARLG